MQKRRIIRFFGVALALLSVLVFVTVVSTGWHHHDSASETSCPYCHLSHQTAVQPETSQNFAALSLLATVAIPKDFDSVYSSDFTLTSPRAPPLS